MTHSIHLPFGDLVSALLGAGLTLEAAVEPSFPPDALPFRPDARRWAGGRTSCISAGEKGHRYVSREEAGSLLAQTIASLRALSYEQLRERGRFLAITIVRPSESEDAEVTGPSGDVYQVQTQGLLGRQAGREPTRHRRDRPWRHFRRAPDQHRLHPGPRRVVRGRVMEAMRRVTLFAIA